MTLLVAPQQIASGAAAATKMMLIVQIDSGVFVLSGPWLTFVGWIAKPSDAF